MTEYRHDLKSLALCAYKEIKEEKLSEGELLIQMQLSIIERLEALIEAVNRNTEATYNTGTVQLTELRSQGEEHLIAAATSLFEQLTGAENAISLDSRIGASGGQVQLILNSTQFNMLQTTLRAFLKMKGRPS